MQAHLHAPHAKLQRRRRPYARDLAGCVGVAECLLKVTLRVALLCDFSCAQ